MEIKVSYEMQYPIKSFGGSIGTFASVFYFIATYFIYIHTDFQIYFTCNVATV